MLLAQAPQVEESAAASLAPAVRLLRVLVRLGRLVGLAPPLRPGWGGEVVVVKMSVVELLHGLVPEILQPSGEESFALQEQYAQA